MSIKLKGLYISKEGKKWIGGANISINSENKTASINGQYVIWDSLVQYTDVNDLNNNEIYDGDIINIYEENKSWSPTDYKQPFVVGMDNQSWKVFGRDRVSEDFLGNF